jgi:hypothetical protein
MLNVYNIVNDLPPSVAAYFGTKLVAFVIGNFDW